LGSDIGFYLWAIAASLVIAYYVLQWIFGAAAANRALDRAFGFFARSARKEK
jgi:hypothetical protein